MRMSSKQKWVNRKKEINRSTLSILSLQIGIMCIYFNSYSEVMALLPMAIYFSSIVSLVLIFLFFVGVAFLIMSIGYNSLCIFFNPIVSFNKIKTVKLVLKSNEYKIQRSKVFLNNCFLILVVCALLLFYIEGVIESSLP